MTHFPFFREHDARQLFFKFFCLICLLYFLDIVHEMYIISSLLSYHFTVFTICRQPFLTQFLFLTSLSVENVQFFNRFDRTVSIFKISIFKSSINSILIQINFGRYEKYFHFLLTFINFYYEFETKFLELKDNVYNTLFKPLKKGDSWMILPLLLKLKSSGWVRLKSRNPLIHPDIIPNYFSHKEDVDVLIDGIQIAMAISNTSVFRRFNSRPYSIKLLGCQRFPFATNEY
ncbi:hypothetical protein V1478_013681 [Vespula squamosa]|uniref:Glucose-methanol-choline oxidoreductase C-terminal domain-containing protein n=1 Tax=Vespula squamosa TaxID=30214 RepID=A0ABD2A884_VESSQ